MKTAPWQVSTAEQQHPGENEQGARHGAPVPETSHPGEREARTNREEPAPEAWPLTMGALGNRPGLRGVPNFISRVRPFGT